MNLLFDLGTKVIVFILIYLFKSSSLFVIFVIISKIDQFWKQIEH